MFQADIHSEGLFWQMAHIPSSEKGINAAVKLVSSPQWLNLEDLFQSFLELLASQMNSKRNANKQRYRHPFIEKKTYKKREKPDLKIAQQMKKR